jgi:hypothetical protein
LASPPSEPYVQFSRIRLSSRWLLHRDGLAEAQAASSANNPCSAKKAWGHSRLRPRLAPESDRLNCCFSSSARNRRRVIPSMEPNTCGWACLK